MKKIALAALLSFAAAAAGAQTLSEALSYGVNDYYGTARSIALGGAMTALGGDLGSIGINPAGSAVAPYSQFTISPGITIMSNTSGYSTHYSEDYTGYLDYTAKKFNIPNIGVALNFDNYGNGSLKSFTLGFVSNATNHFMNDFVGSGINEMTSLLGSFAAGASPYSPESLMNRDNYYSSSIPWNYLTAYQGGMIAEAYDEYGNPMVDADGNYTYLGATEGMYQLSDGSYDIRTQGALDQYSRVQTYGAKYDMIMNAGLNFNDRFFLGFNLGMPVATYRYSEYFLEEAVDPSQFEIEYADGVVTNFSHAKYNYAQTTDVSGIYAKVGFIWVPVGGLRIGAAFQTPTLYTITDSWTVDASTYFTSANYDTSAGSPRNDYTYNLTTPWRFNAGLAYTFGGFGLLSADFEMADYSKMRFSERDYYGSDYFRVENDVNRYFAGKEYSGRFGIEVRPVPTLSLRAGYALRTSPQYYAFDKNGVKYTAGGFINYYDEFASGANVITFKEAFPDLVSTYSCGLGYSSDGSFFSDLAVRYTKYASDYFNPYGDYITGGDEYLPEVVQTRSLADIVLTLGWRF
ncbi:MAG: hypothetical protein IKX07_07670 [Bacteroidales bacterium]|nr:hypothetical protein [Bacteroidales bacterium]